jgi:hypothetical protein
MTKKFTELPAAASVTTDDLVAVVDMAGPTSQKATLAVVRAALMPVVNADVDAAAAVAVSKLAPGTNGQFITTTAGVAVWGAGGSFTAPTGTGLMTTTAGAMNAAASLGTTGQLMRTNIAGTAHEWTEPVVIFNDATPGDRKNVQANLPTITGGVGYFAKALMTNTRKGIVNFASDTNNELGLQDSYGITEDWGVAFGDMPSVTARFGCGGGYRGNSRGQGGFAWGLSTFADGEGSACFGRSSVAGVIGSGVSTGDLTFVAATQKITRASGSWVTDLFIVGAYVDVPLGTLNKIRGYISAVSAADLTIDSAYGRDDMDLAATQPIVDETLVAPANGTVTWETRYAFCSGRSMNVRSHGSAGFGQASTIDVTSRYGFVAGYNQNISAASDYGSAFGAAHVVSGPGGSCFGQTNQAGENAASFGTGNVGTGAGSLTSGYTNTASASYTVGIGQLCNASVQRAIALGYKALGDQYGCLAHASNRDAAGTEGFKGMDVDATGTAASCNLQTVLGEIELQNTKVFSIRVRVMGAKTTASVVAHEIHELLIKTTAGVMTIENDTLLTSTAVDFVSVGWTVAFSVIGGGQPYGLRIACNPGADTVKFAARVEWMAMPGV